MTSMPTLFSASPLTPRFSGEILPNDPNEPALRLQGLLARLSPADGVDLQSTYMQRLLELREELLPPQQDTYAPNGRTHDYHGYKVKTDTTFMPLPEAPFSKPALRGENVDLVQLTNQALAGELDYTVPCEDAGAVSVSIQDHAAMDIHDPQVKTKLDQKMKAGILTSYGIRWPMEKVVRDIFQNFFDAHGGTLGDVRLQITRDPDSDTYHVVIGGRGEYEHELLEDIGATTKQEDIDTAGGFGEGIKVLSMLMLRDGLSDSLSYTCRNWQYEFSIDPSKKVSPLYRTLRIVEDKPGNTMAFTTNNKAFIKALIEGINYFKHDQSPDFNALDYQNEAGGFSVHGSKKKGSLYIANQRTEYRPPGLREHSYWSEGLHHITLQTNTKTQSWDRDRSSLTPEELTAQTRPIAQKMSNEDLMASLAALRDVWCPDTVTHDFYKGFPDKHYKYDETGKVRNAVTLESMAKAEYNNTAGRILLSEVIAECIRRKLTTSFPKKYISLSQAEDYQLGIFQKAFLKLRGYKFCNDEFRDLGMQTAEQFIRRKKIADRQGLSLTDEQTLRLNVLKRTIRILTRDFPFEGEFCTKNISVDKPVYLYDKKAEHWWKSKPEYGNNGDYLWIEKDLLAMSLPEAVTHLLSELMNGKNKWDKRQYTDALTFMIAQFMAVLTYPETDSAKAVNQLNLLSDIWEMSRETEQ